KLELTWIGKDEQPRLEPRILIEDPERSYWDKNSRQYHPDFVAETKDNIYLIETKKEGDIETSDVQEKAIAAIKYCNYATEFTTQNSGKPWKYILIPHNAVQANMSFEALTRKYEAVN
ncbi:MAG TPA: hypothetical protein DHV16_06935, partial [Nitrospiraceae bacterium]|nr:hypothetical protein [Nitrospiraceae bacterium]